MKNTLIDQLRKASFDSLEKRTEINVALIQHNPDVPLTKFIERISDALSNYKTTLHLSSKRVDDIFGIEGISQESGNIRLISWLHEQASKYSYILYEADAVDSNWTKLCINFADQIYIIASNSGKPEKGELEKKLPHYNNSITEVKQYLILIHPNGKRMPKGTMQWLESRSIRHHHIRWDNNCDMQRLARFISGNQICLVLSGGGARGYAHIGAIRAIIEENIPIDVIAGTSMGGLIAVAYAMGWDAERILTYAKEDVVEKGVFKEYTMLPIVAMLKCKKFDLSIKIPCGETLIEDLWLNYFCVSSNITTSELRVHRTGLSWKALRESTSIPGVITPVLVDHNLIADGGLLNNLPCDIMRDLYDGYIIAVDVSGLDHIIAPFEKYPSPWKILFSKILPFKKSINLPLINDILVQSMMTSSIAKKNMAKEHADLYLQPPVEHFKRMDMTAVPDIAETSYRYMKEQFKKWKRKESIQKIYKFQ